MPPSIEELYNRLKGRGTETDEVIERRIKTAKEEINGKDIYDYSLVNEHGKSEDTALKIYQIINK